MNLLDQIKDGFADAWCMTLALVAFVVMVRAMLKDVLTFREDGQGAASPKE